MKPSFIQAQVNKLHQDVSMITDNLSRIEFQEEALIFQSDQIVNGVIEILPEEDDHRPTLIADRMIYAKEMECEDIHVSGSAHIAELSVEHLTMGTTNVVGITGCRGPPGYATNTGATGPYGPTGPHNGPTGPTGCAGKFADLPECHSGLCLVGTSTGLGFTEELHCSQLSFHGPIISVDKKKNNLIMGGYNELIHHPCMNHMACTILPRDDPKACCFVENNGVWCHLLGQGKELSFQSIMDGRWDGTPVQVMVHYISSHPIPLSLGSRVLTKNKAISQNRETLYLGSNGSYQTARSSPIPLERDCLLQGVLSNTMDVCLYILGISILFSTDRLGTCKQV